MQERKENFYLALDLKGPIPDKSILCFKKWTQVRNYW